MKKFLYIAALIAVLAFGYWAYTKSLTVLTGGKRCGGNIQNAPTCDAGYHCAPEPGSNLPFGDVGGICVPD